MSETSNNHYLAIPPSGKGPGVLVLHAWWGLNDFIRSFCDRLAQEGFVALAPDFYGGKVALTVEQAEQYVNTMDRKYAAGVILSAVETLRSHPAVSGQGLGLVGFSLGGFWALWLAQKQPAAFRVVTIFYATGPGDQAQSGAAFQGHFAESDPFESKEDVQALEQGLKSANRPVTFYTYEGTGHWFFEKDRPDAYDPLAAQLAWERTAAFLHEQLG